MTFSLLTRGSEQRLLISNGQIARKMKSTEIENWNHIRVGIRLNFNDIRFNYLNPPPIFIGLCHGTTNKYFSSSTDHAVGFITNENTSSWITSINNSISNIQITTNDVKLSKKESSIKKTYDTTNNNNSFYVSGVKTANENIINNSSAIAVDFIKDSNNLICKYYYNVNSNNVFVSEIDLINFMKNYGPLTNILAAEGSGTITNFDEDTYGALDTVNVGWCSQDYSLEVNSLLYSVFK